ncbi:MAG: hypothetical protein RIQ81_304 [Pseudomonadota bacterium]
MNHNSILSFLALAAAWTSPVAMAERIKHLPLAPSWDYPVNGEVSVSAVGSDYCDMDHGVGCQGANVLIGGPAALVIFNQLPVTAGSALRKIRGIECLQDSATGSTKCLLHVTTSGIGAGETPWISD